MSSSALASWLTARCSNDWGRRNEALRPRRSLSLSLSLSRARARFAVDSSTQSVRSRRHAPRTRAAHTRRDRRRRTGTWALAMHASLELDRFLRRVLALPEGGEEGGIPWTRLTLADVAPAVAARMEALRATRAPDAGRDDPGISGRVGPAATTMRSESQTSRVLANRIHGGVQEVRISTGRGRPAAPLLAPPPIWRPARQGQSAHALDMTMRSHGCPRCSSRPQTTLGAPGRRRLCTRCGQRERHGRDPLGGIVPTNRFVGLGRTAALLACTCALWGGQGKWMFEATLVTSGIQQIGWATVNTPFTTDVSQDPLSTCAGHPRHTAK